MHLLAHLRRWQHSVVRLLLSALVSVALPLTLPPQYVHAAGVVIAGPTGSGAFGTQVVVLPNGNLVITDPLYDESGKTDIGAVYLYTPAGTQISKLTGSTDGDQVGYYGVVVLSNGTYLVSSPYWANGGVTDAGAVTWGSGTAGVAGAVSADNSLVGSTANDYVGVDDVVALSNGNYVVRSPAWDNPGTPGTVDAGAVTWGSGTVGVKGPVSADNSLVGSTANDLVGVDEVVVLSNGHYVVSSPYWNGFRGAVTWGSGTAGVAGAVSASNSLVGSATDDRVGYNGVVALSNGNYVVSSQLWDNGSATDAGAVTWGSGTTGVAGEVADTNSLVGSTANDRVGNYGVVALSNDNYVVRSPAWSGYRGAVTWGSGTVGVAGEVTDTNSLVGSTGGDSVGNYGVVALSNGTYVVRSPNWSGSRGAVTWGSATGVNGEVTDTNSLVGSTANDQVGIYGVVALSNDNYVVSSPSWSGYRGAVTWGSGTAGVAGEVTNTNSLVGSTADDRVGSSGVVALSNGNYVVSSPYWSGGRGAVTWGSGMAGVTGAVTDTNSLVGSTASNYVGNGQVVALSNGNYVVRSPNWDNGSATAVGAVTWGSGTTGVAGTVSVANSLVGSTDYDNVGNDGVVALSNGHYIVRSPNWDNGSTVNVGAVTWGSGTAGVAGEVSADNSLVGSATNDNVGTGGVVALSNGHYVVSSPNWDNGSATDVGAVTWGSGTTGVAGLVSAANSLVGSTDYDQVGSSEVVPLSNGTYVVSSPYWNNGSATAVGAVTWVAGGTAYSAVVDTTTSVVGTVASGGPFLSVAYAADGSVVWVGLPKENKVVQATLQNAPAPTIDSAAPVAGTYGTAYSHTFVASGEPKPTLALTGTLPAGLTFDASTGTLSGTPQATGAFALTLTATSAAGSATQNVTLTIGKRPLTVTAVDASRVYGAANPTFALTYSGFAAGEDASVLDTLPTASTTATASSPAGTYPITVAGGADANYVFTYKAGTLTVGNGFKVYLPLLHKG